MASIEERVKNVIVESLSVDAEKVTPDASFVDDLDADSLDTCFGRRIRLPDSRRRGEQNNDSRRSNRLS
jgi:hypothetical protein